MRWAQNLVIGERCDDCGSLMAPVNRNDMCCLNCLAVRPIIYTRYSIGEDAGLCKQLPIDGG